MQRRWIVVAILVLCMGMSSSLMGAKIPYPWIELKAQGIKALQVTPIKGKNQVVVCMTPIRQALEKAGLRETVMVYLSIEGKEVGCLGKFTPQVRDDGEHGDDKVQQVVVSFPTIPKLKYLPVKWEFGEGVLHGDENKEIARPARPAGVKRPARPARPAGPVVMKRPARLARPALVTRPARPATPIRPARIRMPEPDPLHGILTFRTAQGRTMLYLQVEIIGM